jgi:hypothetical protein
MPVLAREMLLAAGTALPTTTSTKTRFGLPPQKKCARTKKPGRWRAGYREETTTAIETV